MSAKEKNKRHEVIEAAIEAKISEIQEDLASETGVKAQDVSKVLEQLGIQTIVRNQFERIDWQRIRLAVTVQPTL